MSFDFNFKLPLEFPWRNAAAAAVCLQHRNRTWSLDSWRDKREIDSCKFTWWFKLKFRTKPRRKFYVGRSMKEQRSRFRSKSMRGQLLRLICRCKFWCNWREETTHLYFENTVLKCQESSQCRVCETVKGRLAEFNHKIMTLACPDLQSQAVQQGRRPEGVGRREGGDNGGAGGLAGLGTLPLTLSHFLLHLNHLLTI